ncbi:Voltage-gated hydrogen channel [Paramyrothecium foliicola]|nr:Voltage-gated hydrogen channel [Paramyrothecium foliicola]
MPEDHTTRPLLAGSRSDCSEGSSQRNDNEAKPSLKRQIRHIRARGREALSSRHKHYTVMSLVAFDVAALLANVFIQLIACELHQLDEPWVQRLTWYLEIAGLAFSTCFLFEVLACLFAFGPRYLNSWFHLFDSFVVLTSFVIDVAAHGLAESIGSLVIVLRLWRLAKISEEVVLGASERLQMLEYQLEDLADENKELRAQLANSIGRHDG